MPDPTTVTQAELEAALATVRVGLGMIGVLVAGLGTLGGLIWKSWTTRIDDIGRDVKTLVADGNDTRNDVNLQGQRLTRAEADIERHDQKLEKLVPQRR